MKNLTIVLVLMMLMLCSCASSSRRHLGTWKVIGAPYPMTAKFNEKTVELTTPDGTQSVPYVIDHTKTPAWIDLKMPDGTAKGIVEFLGRDVVMAAGSSLDEPRPSSFDSAEGVMIFKRVKDDK